MRNTIYYVGGSKSGVGKSLISAVLIQFLIDRYGESKVVHLIETDESNPDVVRMYSGKIPVTPLILGEQDTGWITLYDILEDNEDTLFVINSAARSNHGIEANGKNFSDAISDKSATYDLVTFWPINRQLDCVNLLIDYLRVIRCGSVFVIRNNYWGEPKDFLIYDAMMKKSQNAEISESRISGTLDFPALNDLITPAFYSYGKTLSEAAGMLNVFRRQIFLSRKNKVYEMFESTGLFANTPVLAENES